MPIEILLTFPESSKSFGVRYNEPHIILSPCSHLLTSRYEASRAGAGPVFSLSLRHGQWLPDPDSKTRREGVDGASRGLCHIGGLLGAPFWYVLVVADMIQGLEFGAAPIPMLRIDQEERHRCQAWPGPAGALAGDAC